MLGCGAFRKGAEEKRNASTSPSPLLGMPRGARAFYGKSIALYPIQFHFRNGLTASAARGRRAWTAGIPRRVPVSFHTTAKRTDFKEENRNGIQLQASQKTTNGFVTGGQPSSSRMTAFCSRGMHRKTISIRSVGPSIWEKPPKTPL